MKKLTVILLTLCLTLTSAFTFTACKDDGGSGGNPGDSETAYYLALNEYDLTLDIGDTFELDVKKYDKDGVEQTITNLSYNVEAVSVASIENGVITAKEAGKTYVNVTADGIDVACFLTVRSAGYLDGLTIRLTAQELYAGIPVQAYAYVYENNVLIAEPEQVTWSIGDGEKATVSDGGLITPVATTEALTITASCTHNGETLTAEKQIAIVEPYYYAISNNMVKLASNVTVTGEENTAYTKIDCITLKKINVLDASDVSTVTGVSVSSNDKTVATAEATEQGVISVNGLNSGDAALTVTATETGKQVAVKVIVYNAIAQVADMDALGFASLLNPIMLSENYTLVNDIDYAGGVIIPIATVNDNGKRVPGNQWKYWLNKTATGYAAVSREDFGKEGQGLTDADFNTFRNAKGINPTNLPFTGTFDGNGYSIKNGQIFYGAMLNADTAAYSVYSSIIGYFKGTLENISFENITQQNPSGLPADVIEPLVMKVGYKFQANSPTLYQSRGASIVGKATNGVIENVYAEINYSLAFTTNYGTDKSVLAVEFGSGMKVSNCVLQILDAGKETDYALDCSLTGTITSSVKNCFAIGVSRFYSKMTDGGELGSSGCWWLGNGKTWADLISEPAGSNASNVLSVEQTKATFNNTVWDMSKFNANDNGRPELIKGCSIA